VIGRIHTIECFFGVCANKGCWIEIAEEDGQKIQIKVYAIHLSREDAVNYFTHVAEERGETFDPASVTGPATIYQIKDKGAEIEKGQ